MLENKRDIHDRIYKFALSVLQLIKLIPKFNAKMNYNTVLIYHLVF